MKAATKFVILTDIMRETAKNVGMMIPLVRAWRLRYPRAAKDFREITSADLSRYVFSALEMVLKYVPASKIEGSVIVEIGPGDNIALGMPLLALGASSYHAIDPFMGNVDSDNARRLYQLLAQELPKRYKMPKEAIPDPAAYPQSLEGKSVFFYRKGIEQYRSFDLFSKADIVFSHGVGQSVASAEAFAMASYEVLKKGGVAVHRIDFGPVGCWYRYKNPLTFLTVKPVLWSLMGSHRGMSNRLRYDQFLKVFMNSGFEVTTYVLTRVSKETVDEITSALAHPFNMVPHDSMQVLAADFVCNKPG